MIIYNEKEMVFDHAITPIMASNLCNDEKCVVLYESENEISVACGCYISIVVSASKIQIRSKTNYQEIVVNDLCYDLEKALSSIAIKDWRMYGWGNFSLARYTYGLNIDKEDEELFCFFIPEKEYRIVNNMVTLRAIEKKSLPLMKECIGRVFIQPEYNLNAVVNPIEIINSDEDYYKNIVSKAISEIKGEKYQKIILSRKVVVDKRLDMKKTYISGRKVNTPAYSYYVNFRGLEIVGFSPETVAEVDHDGYVSTFPLAGTRALTDNDVRNRELRDELLHDTKEIAEHAVSVQLANQEMQSICDNETVVITDFMSVMERGTVQHLGSRLKGKLKENKNAWHALSTLFPAVTASGIPKKEAIEAIGRIEKEARGLYSGSILIYDSEGVMDAALVLRTIFQSEKETWVRVGAGIVELSKPDREFTETQEKVSCIANQLILAE
ncbi:MAG: salicylate synthase [Lachnospiraceae bacterium]|nr:salicylate synthase [Lachnospiraceae bacterium]